MYIFFLIQKIQIKPKAKWKVMITAQVYFIDFFLFFVIVMIAVVVVFTFLFSLLVVHEIVFQFSVLFNFIFFWLWLLILFSLSLIHMYECLGLQQLVFKAFFKTIWVFPSFYNWDTVLPMKGILDLYTRHHHTIKGTMSLCWSF